MWIRNTGNIGVNTDSPTERFHVNGKVRVEDLTGASTVVVGADANGGIAHSWLERIKRGRAAIS